MLKLNVQVIEAYGALKFEPSTLQYKIVSVKFKECVKSLIAKAVDHFRIQ